MYIHFILILCLFLADDNDIIEEALYYFKANVFFKSYEVKVSVHVPYDTGMYLPKMVSIINKIKK